MGSNSTDQASLQTKLEGSAERVSDAAGNSMQMLRSKVRRGWKQIRASLRDADPQKRGWVPAAELRTILERHNVSMTDAQFEDMVSKIDQDGDGHISYMELNRFFGKTLGSLVRPVQCATAQEALQLIRDKLR